MISLSIDLKLIDKSKVKRVTRKNGNEAAFCDLILIETPGSEWGDYMVKQSQTKEAREAGEQTPILGNAKMLNKQDGTASKLPARNQEPDDIEF